MRSSAVAMALAPTEVKLFQPRLWWVEVRPQLGTRKPVSAFHSPTPVVSVGQSVSYSLKRCKTTVVLKCVGNSSRTGITKFVGAQTGGKPAKTGA